MLESLLFLAVLTAATPDPLQQAQADIAAKHYQEALPLLDGLLKANPQDGRALLALGAARRGLGDLPGAVEAYTRAYARPAAATQAATGLFLLYAEAKRPDDASKWFDVMRNGQMGDLSGLAENPEVQSLHGDKRFAILFPDRIAFEPPFVQPVRIIHEWRGEHPGDEFGWIARPAGDVDGDGVADVIVAATANLPYGDGRGQVYLYSGKSGKLLWKVSGNDGANLSNCVEAAGDVDGDKIPDVIAGAPGENAAYVYSGKDGRILRRFTGDATDSDFGLCVDGIGDMDGDGVPDEIVGAPDPKSGADRDGRVYVFSGKDGHRLLMLEGNQKGGRFGSMVGGGSGLLVIGAAVSGKEQHGQVYVYRGLSRTPAFVEDADETGAGLGYMFLSVLGDLDRDGTPDVYAADFSNTAKGRATGRAYVYSGKTGKVLRTLTGEAAGAGFGIGPGVAGDVDHDGYPDIVVGSWQYSGAAWSGGRVQVFSGKDGSLLQDIVGKVPGETLGFDAVGIGDVDGDGLTDYLITSAWSGVSGLRSGRVYIVAGTAGKP